jgi:PAS domain S-box-containing protein
LHTLLIDDNPDDRALVRRELQRAFGKVETTHIIDAAAFDSALNDGDFDLVVTDYQLRWTDGLKVVKAIREKFPDRPIIMYTGTGSEEVAVAAMQAGLDEYVVKSPAKAALVPVAAISAVQKSAQRRQLREQEERTRAILDTVIDGIVTIDESGIIQSFNHAAQRTFGYDDSDVVGQNVKMLMPEPYRSRHDGYLRNYLRTGVARMIGIGREVQGRAKDGRVFPMDVAVGEMMTGSGRRQFIASIRDITQRKEMEEQLRRAQKMESIGQLTGGIAHDFNNLLTVILGNLEMASDRAGADPYLRRAVELATDAAERGAALTRRLLAFSRRQPLQAEPLNVAALVAGLSDLLSRALGGTIELRSAAAKGLWPVLADKDQLENALLNLAINARDAMPNGGKLTIESANILIDEDYIRLNPEAVAGEHVRISVADTGVGMPPEVAARAFEPFFTTKEAGKGTGLGLSMLYGFARQSSGHARIESEVGRGTTVHLYLPRSPTCQPRAVPVGPPVETARRGGETILVVEDDDLVRGTVTAQLERMGYKVIATANGHEAIDILKSRPQIDLMFSDVVMPGGLNGRDLATEALKIAPSLKIILTSGYQDARGPAGNGETDGVELLPKPFKKQDLAKTIRDALDGEPE